MNCRIYLVRHGQTDWNAKMRFQGQTDIHLAEKGREQAAALARRLEKENFAGIYSSDLTRAYETAEIIARSHNLLVQQKPAFREINFGSWEGLTFQEIQENFSEEATDWWERPLYTRIPDGESLHDVVKRSMDVLHDICKKHNGQKILIVSHGGVVRSIISTVLGIDLNEYWRIKQDNLALNIIHFPEWNKGILELLNDCTHLYTT
ncbi:MAG: alpha-ribazole phosphatase [Clostridiales bacterium]|nr:alpha-ribazole phosphatase [Clostridiales bacterium]MCF8023394.1 alpha-ribazole phosphatase [Clostridiales bacterium]